MSAQEIVNTALIAAGAAVGAGFASTGRVLSHDEAEKPWPYLAVLSGGLLLMGFDKTIYFGIGMTAYGAAKLFARLAHVVYDQ